MTTRAPTSSRTATAERFAARARARRLRRLARGFVALLAVGLVGAAVWAVGWSDLLAVREVRVEGASGPLATAVTEAAGITTGTPLVRVDVDAAADRVRDVSDVAEVEVLRSWPRAVTVEVTLRTAAGALKDGDTWWKVDESGVLFGSGKARPEGLPVVTAPAGEAAAPTRAAAIAVMSQLPDELVAQVATLSAESEADVQLVLTDGAAVLWGTPERTADKARVLLTLVAAQKNPPERYDVSAPDRPAVKP